MAALTHPAISTQNINQTTNMDPKRKTPYIKPENRLDMSDIGKDQRPIIELTDDTSLLYIYIVNLKVSTINTDIMASIIHSKKDNTIEMRGRIRREDTGSKSVFPTAPKLDYSEEAMKTMKAGIAGIVRKVSEDLPFVQVLKTPFEISFAVDEDMDSIIKKLNASDQFNIGIADK